MVYQTVRLRVALSERAGQEVLRLREMLEHSAEHTLRRDLLLEEMAIQCPQEDPKRLLRILINWGRFAELWSYQSAGVTLTVNGGHRHGPPDGHSAQKDEPHA